MIHNDDATVLALQMPQSARPATPLPDLSPEQARAIVVSAERSVADLLAHDSLAASTITSYRSALRYWDAWHVAAFGAPLPLLGKVRVGVGSATVLAFIGHHAPLDADVPTTSMPAAVAERLHLLGAVGGARRSTRAGGDRMAISLATMRHRLSSLQACHRLAGLVPEFADDSRVRRAIRALANRYAHAAPTLLRKPKVAIGRDILAGLLATCDDSPLGRRDEALIRLAFVSARRRAELAVMRWSDLRPVVGTEWEWTVRALKGRRATTAEGGLLAVPLLGNALIALLAWRAVAAQIEPGATDTMAVWRRLPDLRRGETVQLGLPMTGHDVWLVIRRRAALAGFDPTHFGAHSLRSGAATTLIDEHIPISEAAKLLAHARIESTRIYDHRPVPTSVIRHLDGPRPGSAAPDGDRNADAAWPVE